MLNEGQVTLLWERLFRERNVTPECLQRANELIEELRNESPLRFRLEKELEEIRQAHDPNHAPTARPKRRSTTK